MSTELAVRNADPIALGEVLSRSGFFADSRDAAQAAVKVMAGAEIGIPAVASMTGVNIIKGRVTLGANLMASCVQRSAYKYRVTEHTDEKCVIVFYGPKIDGNGMEVIGTSKFDKADQLKAKLSGDNWTKFPRNMMFARAISNGAKWYTPDVFGGPVYTPDEVGGAVDGETLEPVQVVNEARPEPVASIEPPKWQPSEPQIVELREAYQRTGWWEPNPPRPADHEGDWPPEGYKPPEEWDPHSRLRMALLSVGSGNQGEIPVLLAGLTEGQFTKLREAMTNAQDARESAVVGAIQESFDATEEKHA